MSLSAGTRVGPYEVVSLLGRGGMGEVYRATDTNLKRQVAIKVLPSDTAGDPDRLARFQREAEVLAALNHPNIAQVYGLEKAEGISAPVMELVEGPTLADRIAKGALPLSEALPIARQIATALGAAHEQGIIHRDLKPANIQVRDDGTVKVLDFGLAKLVEAPAATTHPNTTASPTITTPAMTQAGMILGTAAYMSPERAKGRPADKRGDVWAFGCVLYEMITGRRAFEGEDVTDTLAAVLRGEPDWSGIPASAPVLVRRLLVRCLEKDRNRRISDASGAVVLLEEASSIEVPGGRSLVRASNRLWLIMIAAVIVAIAGTAAVVCVMGPATPLPKVQFTIDTPPERGNPNNIAISPDGQSVVFIGYDDAGTRTVWVRSLDGLVSRAIPGTQTAIAPFWTRVARK